MSSTKAVRALTSNLTSYDLLKAVAVITMVIDHMGYYLFPDELMWRAIGRISFPIWFFLVGYARGRDLSLRLFIGVAILVVSNVVCGLAVFPLNVLVTIILIRMVIDPLMSVALKNIGSALLGLVVVTGAIIPSFSVSEYGTLGLLLAMFGYMTRHRPSIPGLAMGPDKVLQGMALYCFFTILLIQQLFFNFQGASLITFMTGTALVIWTLLHFQSREYPQFTAKAPRWTTYTVQLLGRNTMEIYVIHLVLLKVTGVFTDPARFAWFDWVWYSATGH